MTVQARSLQGSSWWRRWGEETFAAYLFLLPSFVVFVFVFFPLVLSFYVSFTKWNLSIKPSFIGLENYRYLFTDEIGSRAFYRAVANSFYYALGVPLNMAVSLVVALFLNRRLRGEGEYDRLLLPGRCQRDLRQLETTIGIRVELGPKDLLDMPRRFGTEKARAVLDDYSTRILAEIADAPLWPIEDLLAQAEYYRHSGADIIDLGWLVQGDFFHIVEVLQELKARAFRASVDTFHREDVLRANWVGFDYLLSVNGSDLEIARDVDCQKVVVMPNFGQGLESLLHNVERLERWSVAYILDPVPNPLNLGFSDSIARHLPPKNLDERLIALKDQPFQTLNEGQLRAMQKQVRDHNYRIFGDGRQIFAFNTAILITGTDPQAIFGQMALEGDADHAFYVGRELEKAAQAIRLGKRYVQDQPLRWGYLDEYLPGHHREVGG